MGKRLAGLSWSALSLAASMLSAPLCGLAGEWRDEAAVVRRYPAPTARQGVAVDEAFVYAIDNSTLTKYEKRSGERVAEWRGDPGKFPHINSCAVIALERSLLVCASSNYPRVPHWSRVEFFDPKTLHHIRSVALTPGRGSITWIDRRDEAWWVAFANYDGRGGEPPRDHRDTVLVRLDDAWRETGSWFFPASVLERFAPMSSSGGGWGPDGRLYVTGHDNAELYVLEVPEAGTVLKHVGTIAVAIEGQAIDWDESQPWELYGISLQRQEIIRMRIPPRSTSAARPD
jgi:hypothetical protein